MKVISVASQKGGAGKSTICAHLAVLASEAGQSVLIDTDPQGSLAAWWRRREVDDVLMVECRADELADVLEAARRDETAFVIIDCPPHREAGIAEAMRLADLVVIPVRPSFFDLEAAGATFEMAATLKRHALAVLNACPPRVEGGETSIVREARAVLDDLNVSTAKTAIVDRADYRHALIAGASVIEYAPASKADDEMRALWREINQELNA